MPHAKQTQGRENSATALLISRCPLDRDMLRIQRDISESWGFGMYLQRMILTLSISVLVATLSASCGRSTTEGQAPSNAEPTPSLPISYNRVMVALVNDAADPIWRAVWQNPETEAEWRELERRAFQLAIAGSLLSQPGIGEKDAEWAANPAWQAFATQLKVAAEHAVDAVQARDIERIYIAGDEIVTVCEACHTVFKPDLPTEGLFGELSPTSADLESDESSSE